VEEANAAEAEADVAEAQAESVFAAIVDMKWPMNAESRVWRENAPSAALLCRVARQHFVRAEGTYRFIACTLFCLGLAINLCGCSSRAGEQSFAARFVITFDQAIVGAFDPEQVDVYTSEVAMKYVASDDQVAYERWRIDVVGDLSGLPDPLELTILWAGGSGATFLWDDSANNSALRYIDLPHTGGTIGIDGSLIDSFSSRPSVIFPGSGSVGTLELSAPNVESLTVDFVRNQ